MLKIEHVFFQHLTRTSEVLFSLEVFPFWLALSGISLDTAALGSLTWVPLEDLEDRWHLLHDPRTYVKLSLALSWAQLTLTWDQTVAKRGPEPANCLAISWTTKWRSCLCWVILPSLNIWSAMHHNKSRGVQTHWSCFCGRHCFQSRKLAKGLWTSCACQSAIKKTTGLKS